MAMEDRKLNVSHIYKNYLYIYYNVIYMYR